MANAGVSQGHIHDDLVTLLKIQDKDAKGRRLQAELAEKPLELESLKNRLSEHRKRVEEFRESMKKKAAERNALEVELESRIQTIRKYEAQSSLVKTNEEYRALIKEIEELKKGNKPLEDKILDVMEKQEEAGHDLVAHDASLKDEEGKLKAQEIEMAKETEGMRAHLDQIKKEREGLLAGVKPELLERYDMIFENKDDYAIVTIEHGACGGCHMAIIPQVMNEVKRGHELVMCENCGRILFLPKN